MQTNDTVRKLADDTSQKMRVAETEISDRARRSARHRRLAHNQVHSGLVQLVVATTGFASALTVGGTEKIGQPSDSTKMQRQSPRTHNFAQQRAKTQLQLLVATHPEVEMLSLLTLPTPLPLHLHSHLLLLLCSLTALPWWAHTTQWLNRSCALVSQRPKPELQ
jgi:hypothetical protein